MKYSLSIIISAHNAVQYIDQCILSLNLQDHPDWQAVIFDDASTDGTGRIIDFFSKKFNNIKRLSSNINVGQGVGRNTAMHLAEGDYITVVDADDFISSESLALNLQRAIAVGCDTLISPYNKFYGDEVEYRSLTNRPESVMVPQGNFSAKEALNLYLARLFGTWASWSSITKRSVIVSNSCLYSSRVFYQDVIFNLLKLNSCNCVSTSNIAFYNNRISNVSATRRHQYTQLHFVSTARLYYDLCSFIISNGLDSALSEGFSRACEILMNEHLPRMRPFLENFNKLDKSIKRKALFYFSIMNSTFSDVVLKSINAGQNAVAAVDTAFPELGQRDEKNPTAFSDSFAAMYWENRYSSGRHSGSGSRGRLAQFKADFLNGFIEKTGVKSVIDLGCGDGENIGLINFKSYIGYDVSQTAVDLCNKKYQHDRAKSFYNMSELSEGASADLTISLDVLYHIIEEENFISYLHFLFSCSDRFVIIYASNDDFSCAPHVRSRKFMNYIDLDEWRLIEKVNNPFVYDESDKDNTTFSNFYVFEKIKSIDDYQKSSQVEKSHVEKVNLYLGSDDTAAYKLLRNALIADDKQDASIFDLAKQELSTRVAPRILDLGCGKGESVSQFTSLDPTLEWFGVDISDSDEVLSREKKDKRIYEYDGIHIPFDDNFFDIIYCRQVLEHVEHYREFLQNVFRVLKHGGVFIASLSQLEPYHSRSYGNFTCYGMYKILKVAGFDVKRFVYGIDALSLIRRRLAGRTKEFSHLFEPKNSPLYQQIDKSGAIKGFDDDMILYWKLLFSGHIGFIATK